MEISKEETESGRGTKNAILESARRRGLRCAEVGEQCSQSPASTRDRTKQSPHQHGGRSSESRDLQW